MANPRFLKGTCLSEPIDLAAFPDEFLRRDGHLAADQTEGAVAQARTIKSSGHRYTDIVRIHREPGGPSGLSTEPSTKKGLSEAMPRCYFPGGS
ncbi:hypothetical protein [Streptomyces sp. HUAS TT7]|uniref:hypothetical protein n=1 Tax=Streptomyces sp. HUAS TT7 TaxID=3447507 RepID=UPI003F65E1B8